MVHFEDPASHQWPHATAGETSHISLRMYTPALANFSSHRLDWRGGAAQTAADGISHQQHSKVQVQTL